MSCFLSFLLTVIFFASVCAESLADQIRTLNLDFGNGEQYVGDDGILSSPGGTFWNKISVNGNAFDFDNFTLRDEFGNRFPFRDGDDNYPEVTGVGVAAWVAPDSSYQGPMSDGIVIEKPSNEPSELLIRQFSKDTPIEVVVYFSDSSTVDVAGGFRRIPRDPTNDFGSLNFPGVPGQGYAYFQGIDAETTTLGFPELPGIHIVVPEGSTSGPLFRGFDSATITAMQVRGVFNQIPEPSSLAITGLAGLSLLGCRRCTAK